MTAIGRWKALLQVRLAQKPFAAKQAETAPFRVCPSLVFSCIWRDGAENSDQHRGELRGLRQKKGDGTGVERGDAAQMAVHGGDGRCHGGLPSLRGRQVARMSARLK